MAKTTKPPGPLSAVERIVLVAVAVLMAAAVVYYLGHPPTTTKTTTEEAPPKEVIAKSTEQETQIGETIVLGGFGFAAILGLTAFLNGRLKLTGPGGSGVEVAAVAVAAAADATVDPLVRENERLQAELKAKGLAAETPQEVKEAVVRWNDVKAQLFGNKNV